MPTVAELAAQEYQEIGYVLFIEGWHVAFTNRAELAGTSWISQDVGEADRVVALGLELPPTVKMAVGIIDSGMLTNDDATFTIVDRDEHLIGFVEDEAGDIAYERLAPTDDPAPATLIGPGEANIDLRGRWINGESIGGSGERRQFQIFPGGTLPGYDHASIDDDSGRDDLRASTILDAARWLEGRLCALYLIRRDPVAGTWAAWSDQHASGYSLIYWGTIRSCAPVSHVWTIQCEGPGSWLRRPLNMNRPADWRPLTPVLELAEGENYMGCGFAYLTAQSDVASREVCASSLYQAGDALTSGQTPSELALEIDTRLQTIAATAGPDQTFTAFQNGVVKFFDDQVTIKVDDNNGGTALGGILVLRMHAKVWFHLGWDLALQARPGGTLEGEHEVLGKTTGSAFKVPWLDAIADPGPGYWEAWFTTCPAGLFWGDSPADVDGDGAARVYRPIYGGGGAMLYPEAGQLLDFGFTSPYLEGQLARPPADKAIDAGTCDATGFIAIRGPFKSGLDADVETRYQLGKISWVNDATTITTDSDSRAVVWLEAWLDPKAFGAENGKLDGVWAAKGNDTENTFEYVPVALLGYNLTTPDAAHRVLARLLLSSGTALWTGTEGDPDAAITSGDNAHDDADGSRADDQEIADLGLCIPQDMIDLLSFRDAAEALPGGIAGPLNQMRLCVVGPFDSQQMVEDIIRPRGWCLSLAGGRYGLFARNAPLDVEDAVVTITQADIAGAPDELPPSETGNLRPLEPVDLIEVTYGGNQFDGNSGAKTTTIKARDPRAAQRRGNARVEINGRTLLASGAWMVDFTRLWGDQLARWFAEPWALITVAVKGHVARDLWPGTIVRYTSPWPATREGDYGMTARLGRVVSVERDLQTLAATVEILVQSGDPTTVRRFGPAARLVDDHTTIEGRYNASTRTLTCYADAFGRGSSVKDVAAFAEPAWAGVGGNLVVNVWQSWDGVEWENTASFESESVNTTANTITYVAGSLTGTIWERRFGLLLPAKYDDQNASEWARAVFGVVCGTDGKHSAGNLDGYPWVE